MNQTDRLALTLTNMEMVEFDARMAVWNAAHPFPQVGEEFDCDYTDTLWYYDEHSEMVSYITDDILSRREADA